MIIQPVLLNIYAIEFLLRDWLKADLLEDT